MAAALAALAALGGCGAADDGGCPEPALALRDPRTLGCEEWHVPSAVCPDEPAPPTWAACGACTAVRDPAACLAEPGCRGAYDACLLDASEVCRATTFVCVGVDRAGPVAGACADLDAVACSSRDDCIAWYQRHPTCGEQDEEPEPRPHYQPNQGSCALSFLACADEATAP